MPSPHAATTAIFTCFCAIASGCTPAGEPSSTQPADRDAGPRQQSMTESSSGGGEEPSRGGADTDDPVTNARVDGGASSDGSSKSADSPLRDNDTSANSSTATDNATTEGGSNAGDPDPQSNEDAASSPNDENEANNLEDQEASDAPNLGAPTITDDLRDPPSRGGTLTFESIGARGWYPSIRDPNSTECDAYEKDGCCLTQQQVTSDLLTPWDQDLILTLRGPIQLAQLLVYQPRAESPESWQRVSTWTADSPAESHGIALSGYDAAADFSGTVGTECLVDVSTAEAFPCGAQSSPYCSGEDKHWGWAGSKLLLLLARMPHASDLGSACSDNTDGNWYDAPWIGLSLGELVRAGAFSSCHCYAKNPEEWYLGDGCGQFNAFEVVNDNNEYTNLELFSTNFFGYGGYVGEGPCGENCDLSELSPEADLVDKSTSGEATMGAVASPEGGPGAAFRRPLLGFRYFAILFDVNSRTVQLAMMHPDRLPPEVAPLLPAAPAMLDAGVVEALRTLRLPKGAQ